MAVPKKRKTHGRTRMGRSHHALKAVDLSECTKCHAPKLAHTVCANCGTYKDKQVIRTQVDKKLAQKAKKEKKAKAATAKKD